MPKRERLPLAKENERRSSGLEAHPSTNPPRHEYSGPDEGERLVLVEIVGCGGQLGGDVVARCLLSEAIRLFRQGRPIDDIAAELTAAADNLDEDEPLAFIRP